MSSDRCTYRLHTPYEWECIQAHRAWLKAREEFAALAELVLEAVHPGNLGALPPSPNMLRYKARQIGLI